LAGDQGVGPLADEWKHLRRQCFPGNLDLVSEPDALLQLGDANLEEFVQIARQDAQEAQPLENRNPAILGLSEDAFVEREQGKLASEELRLDLAYRNKGSLEHKKSTLETACCRIVTGGP
jgi:hypothetical protein